MLETFVGIDQTGAVVRGKGRPLPAACVTASGELVVTALASASRAEIARLAGGERGVAIVLDCVIGLPAACWRGAGADDVWRLLSRARAAPGLGRAAAEAFFARWTPPAGAPPPRRACELLVDANSVLTTRPYQKNVQTGTFRVWKDLTADASRWANVWPFEVRARRGRPWIFEGYPSWMWTRLFGLRRRAPERFGDVVARAIARGVPVRASRALVARIARDADLADAAVLAIGAACLHREGRLLSPFRGFARHPARRREGWIVGVTT